MHKFALATIKIRYFIIFERFLITSKNQYRKVIDRHQKTSSSFNSSNFLSWKKSSLTQTAINSLIVEFRNPSAVKKKSNVNVRWKMRRKRVKDDVKWLQIRRAIFKIKKSFGCVWQEQEIFFRLLLSVLSLSVCCSLTLCRLHAVKMLLKKY